MSDFGFIEFSLLPSWIARLDLDSNYFSLSHLKKDAYATISLFSAGNENQPSNFDYFYEQALESLSKKSLHFNDLAEDCDYEILIEILKENRGTEMQHLLFRLCGDVIVLAKLIKYDHFDEEEVRAMLTTLSPGRLSVSANLFSQLEIPSDLVGWDRIGDTWTTTGGTN